MPAATKLAVPGSGFIAVGLKLEIEDGSAPPWFQLRRINPGAGSKSLDGTHVVRFQAAPPAEAELAKLFITPAGKLLGVIKAIGRYRCIVPVQTTLDGAIDKQYRGGSQSAELGELEDAIMVGDKLVIAGATWGGENSGWAELLLIRLNSDGTRDQSFGRNGQVAQAFEPRRLGADTSRTMRLRDIGHSVAVQQDGKLLVAGELTISGRRRAAVLRYRSDGVLDDSFGRGGVASIPTPENSNAVARIVMIQPSGKIVVCGEDQNRITQRATSG